ncbi:hypothetical protein ENKNEFLB_01328 [Nocardioides aquaticus]|uniref:CAAX prenyl protease 2/Lysostaphin resistance protein A-like domain-containing protein n=1 Tax=Nocardioides aquaticus TaxID=160826 RepID=A0ABX8EGC9_9ACTN|nr:type II CAAX endopeptidase family protein [Nocardioides aquaticus]QVT78950.1 hypothetical protein ENKNEFLB_01328 [Nocardioides aquaticus]
MSSTPPPPGPPTGPPPHPYAYGTDPQAPPGPYAAPYAAPNPYGGRPMGAPAAPEQRPSEVPYHRIHRIGAYGRHGWWRALVGVLLTVAGMLLVVPLVVLLGFVVFFLLTGGDVADRTLVLVDTSDVTPLGLAYLNLSLAGSILVAWFVTRVLHGLRPGWLSSVRPRIRWGWFAVSLGLSVVALVATLVVSALLPAQADGATVSTDLNSFTTTTRDFLLVVLLLTPLQAAGEEYVFRGYLTQALGGVFANPKVAVVVAVLVPSLLFALAHGAQDAPIFFDRFAFGLVAGVLTIATGGLEAAIAMHVLNNFLAFGLALSFGDMSSALNPTGGTWWSIPVTLTQSVTYTALAIWVARATGVATRTAPGAPFARTGGAPQDADRGPVFEGTGPRV